MKEETKPYDLVYAMGCSFVQGSELGPDNENLPNTPVKSVPGRFSEIVADHFKTKHLNLAQGGAGQSRIFRTTMDYLDGSNLKNEKILFLIGLSFPLRQEVFVNTLNKWQKWNIYSEKDFVELVTYSTIRNKSTDKFKEGYYTEEDFNKFKMFYLEYIQNERESLKDGYRLMLSLKSYIKDKSPKSDIFMFSALGDNWPEHMIKTLDLDRKYNPWSKYIVDNNLKDPCCWHPKEAAHKELANYIIKKYS